MDLCGHQLSLVRGYGLGPKPRGRPSRRSCRVRDLNQGYDAGAELATRASGSSAALWQDGPNGTCHRPPRSALFAHRDRMAPLKGDPLWSR
jgi:hypothetical protein